MNKEEIWKQHFTINGCLAETLFRPEMKKAIEDAMDDYAMRQAKNISSKPIADSLPLEKVTRLEVINHKDQDALGRAYVHWRNDNKIEGFLQDSGRTLKLFISKR